MQDARRLHLSGLRVVERIRSRVFKRSRPQGHQMTSSLPSDTPTDCPEGGVAFLSPQHTDTTCTLSALVGAYVHGGRRRATPTRLARPPRTAALTSIFEQGRLGHRNGEAPNDGAEHQVANAREPEQTRSGNGARQRGLDSFLSGTASNQKWSAGAAGRGMPASGRGRRRLWQAVQLPGQEAHNLRRHPHARR